MCEAEESGWAAESEEGLGWKEPLGFLVEQLLTEPKFCECATRIKVAPSPTNPREWQIAYLNLLVATLALLPHPHSLHLPIRSAIPDPR